MASVLKVDKLDPQSGTALEVGTSGDTINVPSGVTLDINSGATISNSGTATGFAGIAWQSVETGATFTAVAGNGYPVNTTAQACTVTLPASASVGDQIIFTDYARNWSTYALTIDPNSLKFQGNTTPQPVYDTDGESVHIVYMDVTKGWVPLYDGAVSLETPQNYDGEYLIVAGGGAGGEASTSGGYARGGGGAGGMLSNFGGVALSLSPGTVYTVAVGDGGAIQTDQSGGDGGDSSITGSDITDVTATGGGGGGGQDGYAPGRDGGSGGGAQGGAGGGGGAGGFKFFPSKSVSATTYTVTLNAGGAGTDSSPYNGDNGGTSVFASDTSAGGGGGGGANGGPYTGYNGASGGGGTYTSA